MTSARHGRPHAGRDSIGARVFTGLVVGLALAVGAAGNAAYALGDAVRAARLLLGRRR